MYHSIDPGGSVISVSPESFRMQMMALATSGIPVVPLRQVLRQPGSVAITFDDAFSNVREHAIPVLQELGFHATVFAVTAHCGRFNDWAGQPAGIPRLPLMDWEQLRELERIGLTIGAHTKSHSNLNRLPPAAQAAELVDSKHMLEDRLGKAVEDFAYPYGESSPATKELASQHFQMACGTSLELADEHSDRFYLPRIDAFYLRHIPLASLFTPAAQRYLAVRQTLRRVRGALEGDRTLHQEAGEDGPRRAYSATWPTDEDRN